MNRSQMITLWVMLILLVLVVYNAIKMNDKKIQQLSYSEFLQMANQGEITRAGFDDQDVTITDNNGNIYKTYLPFRDPDLVKELTKTGINIYSQKPSWIPSVLLNFFPFLILIAFWIFMMKRMSGGSGKVFSFGKSRAKLFIGGNTKVSFDDVAGVEEAKEELEEIIEFLKEPKKFQRLGGRIPRGVLLLGRPGTGKTLLAKAVAGEAKVPFYSISGSDFVEMFVGVGASRVRDLFAEAKKNAPCIAFIDEIDAVGRHRGTGVGGGHDEREQTLNQLLVEMDGFEQNDTVIIIAATNRPDVLDPALLRPGRFDRQVVVDLPDIKGREAILKVHSKKVPLAKGVNFAIIARVTSGFSGADLANLVNEAALLAARNGKKKIDMDDFEEAKDKVSYGKARKSRVISEEDKKITAYHEIGHVLCAVFQEKANPVHKVTIIPRGFAAGTTHFLEKDETHVTKSYLEQLLVYALGGRAAEEIAFKEISTGASSDIQRVSDIAKSMVCSWGMSDKIGPIAIGKDDQMAFLGKQLTQTEVYSEETAKVVDKEIRLIIKTAHEKALKILKNHKQLLKILSKELIKKETLNIDELYSIILENISDEEKIIVNKKLDKAKEMKLENLTEETEIEIDEKDEEDSSQDEKEQVSH
ncbi:MAG: ATP-dependent zinc metalloprotease FtsH [Candidatus Cloacimonetes bacterium]|nr:ATP-dependent zinc metalloprotease FtsH [Candidatus Cloacimonadota bacterium]